MTSQTIQLSSVGWDENPWGPDSGRSETLRLVLGGAILYVLVQRVWAFACMDDKVRLCVQVSTRDLDLQLFGREGRLCRYFLPFNYKQFCYPEGENITPKLAAALPTPQNQGPSLRRCVSTGSGDGRPGSWPVPSRPRT